MSTPFVSRALNREDVVLWRALRHVSPGHYLEVDETGEAPVTRSLAEHGWTGTVVLAPDRHALHAAQRPQDLTLAPAQADQVAEPDGDLHVLVLHAGDTSRSVLAAIDLDARRPWVVVADASLDAGRLAAAGWTPGVHDGVSRFWSAPDHPELAAQLDHPACSLDDSIDARVVELEERVAELSDQLSRWRGRAISSWAAWEPRQVPDWSVDHQRELDRAKLELAQMQQTISWRLTRPIRAFRRRMGAW
ncbi:hypothetical protein OEB99_16055 [Actinotalea sp. M2MS4P-6]|uniref:hypothetical protein n=1 Tax=Actinotalea sp. M2MS4P-6 TaxID=2983762 RepID=UPI0021E49B78|nr:hypothetical protein [Actinotalea sp. M2MS4P-6]MCV2395829.1 hypothetical protein [Actinotalea sp. M2MS4P-6]